MTRVYFARQAVEDVDVSDVPLATKLALMTFRGRATESKKIVVEHPGLFSVYC